MNLLQTEIQVAAPPGAEGLCSGGLLSSLGSSLCSFSHHSKEECISSPVTLPQGTSPLPAVAVWVCCAVTLLTMRFGRELLRTVMEQVGGLLHVPL